jgi:Uma2 family endonuclease
MTYIIDIRAFTEQISDRELEMLTSNNPDLKFETDAQGKLVIMSPTGSLTGELNGNLFFQIKLWNNQTLLGKVFDSSTGFKLSNGAVRSPDVSWIAINRWNSLNDKQKRGFAPIDPDFVIELLSPSDDLVKTQQKMNEYISCGVKLGWLINPNTKEVEIYCHSKNKQVLNNPRSLSGEEFLPGLIIDLINIF